MNKLLVILILVCGAIFACVGSMKFGVVPTVPAAIQPAPGQVYMISTPSTFKGMLDAVRQAPGTFLLIKDDIIMFSWPVPEGGQAFAMLSSKLPTQAVVDFVAKAGGKGSLVNLQDMKDLLNCLKNNGWQIATPTVVPVAIKIALTGSYAWMVNMTKSLPTFVFMPAGAIPSWAKATPILQ